MVGIGTSDVNLDKYRHTFCSLLGKDADSWGLSYTGKNNKMLMALTVGILCKASSEKLATLMKTLLFKWDMISLFSSPRVVAP